MGLDLLDLQFRIERAFKVKLFKPEFQAFLAEKGRETSVGDLDRFVRAVCVRQNVAVTHGAWHRLKKCIVDASGVSPNEIRPETKLFLELGFS